MYPQNQIQFKKLQIWYQIKILNQIYRIDKLKIQGLGQEVDHLRNKLDKKTMINQFSLLLLIKEMSKCKTNFMEELNSRISKTNRITK